MATKLKYYIPTFNKDTVPKDDKSIITDPQGNIITIIERTMSETHTYYLGNAANNFSEPDVELFK